MSGQSGGWWEVLRYVTQAAGVLCCPCLLACVGLLLQACLLLLNVLFNYIQNKDASLMNKVVFDVFCISLE